MIGDMIARICKDKSISNSELSRRTHINVGHLCHIEKGERNPSHRALKTICRALEVPYQPLMYTYDKVFTNEQIQNNMPEHISYDKVLAVGSLDEFITCPAELPNASIAFKITDDAMQPRLEKDTYAFLEFNTPLENKDIGVFEYNGQILVRRYVVKKDGLLLRADNKEFKDLPLNSRTKYTIIGKVVGTSTGLIF